MRCLPDVWQTGGNNKYIRRKCVLLIVMQIPVADARPFFPQSDTVRLPKPSWPIPATDEHFVRRFGPVRMRPQGGLGLRYWNDEIYYCPAVNAIKIPNLDQIRTDLNNVNGKACAFRRLFSDGSAVVRIQLGVDVKINRLNGGIEGDELIHLATNFLELHTKVMLLDSDPVTLPLQLQRKNISKLFYQATTPVENIDAYNAEQVGVVGELPMVLMQYAPSEIRSLPNDVTEVGLPGTQYLPVSYMKVYNRGRSTGVWLLQSPKRQRKMSRMVRICLMRLHAEEKVLRRILELLVLKKIKYQPRTAHGDVLEDYLNKTFRYLDRKELSGINQGSIVRILNAYEQGMPPGVIQNLRVALDGARRQISNKLEWYVNQPIPEPHVIYYIDESTNTIIKGDSIQEGGKQVNNTTITFGDGVNFTGDINTGTLIKDSYNRAGEAESEGLVRALQNLTVQVKTLCERQQSPEEQQAIARKLDTLVREAASGNPDKNILKVTADGLKEAAGAVADIAGPVLKAVGAVLTIFGL